MTTPIFARDVTAARMLDMKPAEYRRLVEIGALPRPRIIEGMERWYVPELVSIINGDAAKYGGTLDF